MTISELIQGVSGASEADRKQSERHWDSLAKPLGSLGTLEHAITRIAALCGQHVSLRNAVLLVFCADNGVVAQGVSQSDSSVTTAVARALAEGTSTVSYMAKSIGCRVVPVNVGMADSSAWPGLLDRSILRGTEDISTGPAMTREACEQAILLGANLVRQEKEQGADLILLGEMGIGNTTTSSAVASSLLKMDPELLTGRGAGLSEEGLHRKLQAIRYALKINSPDPEDPVDVLQKVGGLDLAALTGACLAGAAYRIPVILDGVITCAAALCAVRLCPACADALLASHISREPAAQILLRELKLETAISADLHLGEGSGAVLYLSMLRQVLTVYNSGHTFGHLGIEAYTPQ